MFVSLDLVHYADMLAIPFFVLLVLYFSKMQHKSATEIILYLFSLVALIVDVGFTTYQFLANV